MKAEERRVFAFQLSACRGAWAGLEKRKAESGKMKAEERGVFAFQHSAFYLHIWVAGAHGAQRAALAADAVLGTLARIHKGAPRTRPILAWAGGQAVVDALLDDQCV